MASIKKIEGKGGVSYKITVSMGRDMKDKQLRHYKTWKPDKPMTARQMEKEVQRIAYEFERDLQVGFQADNRQTFEQYATYVIDLKERHGASPSTISIYKMFMCRLSPLIGHNLSAPHIVLRNCQSSGLPKGRYRKPQILDNSCHKYR